MQALSTTHRLSSVGLAAALLVGFAGSALASSHREAPSITNSPKADGTDFYMFRSYESGRAGYVTLIANYQPLQAPYGGPNYFKMDPDALYEIHIDNDGDAREEITFQFRFTNTLADITVPAGVPSANVSIPLTQGGFISGLNSAASNVRETYTVAVVRGDRRTGTRALLQNTVNGSTTFEKPVDNIGTKTIADYAAYAAAHVYGNVTIPGCAMPAKVFVGQRQEAFAVNLGPIFDLVNAPLGVITDPAAINAAAGNSIQDTNVTSLALEVHKDCLTAAPGASTSTAATIGGWTTASLRQGSLKSGAPRAGYNTGALNAGPFVQVSRLGMPLVNEVVIGLKDKDRFNASKPMSDTQFAQYVTNPTLPVLIGIAYGLNGGELAPTNPGRVDLQTVFLTGIAGVNQMATVTPSEMLRLNTAIEPVPFASQNRLGIVGNILANGSDNAGFPNGRRPKDDIVDISLVAVMGGLCTANGTTNALGFGAECNPNSVAAALRAPGTNGLPTVFNLNDAVDQAVVPLLASFPYLNTPNPGAN